MDAGWRKRWFRLAAAGLPLVLVFILDVALGLAGIVPPQDPLLFYSRTYSQDFSPFRDAGNGHLEIRPDWINPGVGLQATQGAAAGRFFLNPGFRPVRFPIEKGPDSWVHLTTSTEAIRKSDLARVRRVSADRAAAFVESVDDLLAAYKTLYDPETEEASDRAVGLGVFYFEEDKSESDVFK